MRFKVEKTKRGLPAFWEEGGGFTNTGRATIVCGSQGQKKKPIYIRRKGSLACEKHALFILHEGDYIIKAWQHRGDYTIEIYKVKNFIDDEVEVELVNKFSEGEWDKDLETFLKEPVKAAMKKARIYHCRYPVYYKKEDENE